MTELARRYESAIVAALAAELAPYLGAPDLVP